MATAIALFGFQSGAALATVVGVLVEVPVMLLVVHLVRRSRGWYERARIGQDLIWIAEGAQTMQSKNPFRHHTPDDDPEAGTPGTGEDVCPECNGTGKQLDKETDKPTDKPCERCDGTGIIVQGIG